MATKPELNIAVAYAKNKASEYNENFDRLLNYIEEVSEELSLKVNTINSQLSSNVLSARLLETLKVPFNPDIIVIAFSVIIFKFVSK